VQAAIVIDIAFVIAVFLFVSLVRPDLHIEDSRSLLEFRDPLTLTLKTENVRADENPEASQWQCVPHQETCGGTDWRKAEAPTAKAGASRAMRCKTECPLWVKSGLLRRTTSCPLWAKSGQCQYRNGTPLI